MSDPEAGRRPASEPGPYRVLARKYRPATFAGLIGQDAMVRTLTNALRSGRLAHAYMLSGVRGIGKTTTARIIARALNCIGPGGANRSPTSDPCGICEHCLAIAEDRHLDVIEMDAASHTGVDNIRELLDGVPYRPVLARYKVYIIDEVHMLSEKAFNALLKTLEEPPEHVKFVFATTEIRKVPVTVLSRCQRFDLRRVEAAAIVRHLQEIAEKEAIEVAPAAFEAIARAAEGSVRDALSLLDQAVARGEAAITEAAVRDMLGLVDRGTTFDLFEAVMRGDAAAALALFERGYAAGADPAMMLEDVLDFTHWITRIKVAAEAEKSPGATEAERVRGRRMAESVSMADVTLAWQMLLKGLAETRAAPQPAQAAEMVLVRLAYAARLPTPAEAIRSLMPGPSPSPAPGAKIEATRPATVGATLASAEEPVSSPSARPVAEPTSRLAVSPTHPSALVAVDAEPVPLPASQAGVALPDPRSFEEVVELVRAHKEAILYGHLAADVRLVHFEIGHIEINLGEDAPADLPQRLSRFLAERTRERWLVTISRQDGRPTLYEQRRAAEAARLQRAADHPLVREIMRVFPGATIENVRDTAPLGDEPVAEKDDQE